MNKFELRIRNVDGAAMEKLNQLAKEKGMSRNAFVKEHLERFVALGDVAEVESRYEKLLFQVIECLRENNDFLSLLKEKTTQEEFLCRNKNES